MEKKIIIDQKIALDATPEAFALLSNAIVIKEMGYNSYDYILLKKPLELIISNEEIKIRDDSTEEDK